MYHSSVNEATSRQTQFFTDDVINEHIRSLNDQIRNNDMIAFKNIKSPQLVSSF